VELGNKMFVRMRFTKSVTPTKGKGVPKKNDGGGETWKPKQKRFVEAEEEDTGEDEGKVLKPCVYKIR